MIVDGNEIKIVGMTRVRNCGKYLPRLLAQYDRICDKILVLDDKSTDNTADICRQFSKVDYYYHTENKPSNWQFLWTMVAVYNPDWVIGLDGDELFDESQENLLLQSLLHTPEHIEAWSFPFFYNWGEEKFYRTDGWYGNVTAVRAFRYKQGMMSKDDHRHITAKPEGIYEIETCADIRIKHFGYMTEEDRLEKWNYYKNRDADLLNNGTVNYDHFAPEAQADVKEWGDWKGKYKLYVRDLEWRPGGYVHVTDTFKERSNSVDEIFIDHKLEYYSIGEVMPMLMEFNRVLKPKGMIELMVYDLNFLCTKYGLEKDVAKRAEILEKLYGKQLTENDFHKVGFDWDTLHNLLINTNYEGLVSYRRGELLHIKAYKKGE